MVAGPVWDYNLAYGNCNFANANNVEAWCYEGASNNPTPAMWQRLLQDPAFRKAVKTRYQELRKGVLSIKHINDYIDRQAKLLAQARERHFKEYPELLVSPEKAKASQEAPATQGGFGMFGGFGMGEGGFDPVGMFAAYRVSSYEDEIRILKKWFADRLDFLDKNIGRFDKDWEPRVQELVERKMQFPAFPQF